MSVAAFAEEAGISRALIHRDCADLLERIKGGENKGRNREFRSEVAESKTMLAKNATLIRINMALSNARADNSNVTQLIYN